MKRTRRVASQANFRRRGNRIVIAASLAALIVSVITLTQVTAQGPTYDAVDDFSHTSNGSWSSGWEAPVTITDARPTPQLTPIGNGKIAFVTSRDGNNEVYVMGPDGSNPTPLTNNSADDEFPAWSPTGAKI